MLAVRRRGPGQHVRAVLGDGSRRREQQVRAVAGQRGRQPLAEGVGEPGRGGSGGRDRDLLAEHRAQRRLGRVDGAGQPDARARPRRSPRGADRRRGRRRRLRDRRRGRAAAAAGRRPGPGRADRSRRRVATTCVARACSGCRASPCRRRPRPAQGRALPRRTIAPATTSRPCEARQPGRAPPPPARGAAAGPPVRPAVHLLDPGHGPRREERQQPGGVERRPEGQPQHERPRGRRGARAVRPRRAASSAAPRRPRAPCR